MNLRAWEMKELRDRLKHYLDLLRIQLGLYRHGNEWAKEELYNGNLAVDRGEFREAIRCYTRALQLKDNLSDAYLGRGIAYYNLERQRRSVRELTKALKFDGDLATAYYYRGLAKLKLAEYRDGILDFTNVIELAPNFERGFINRGVGYGALGEYQLAISDFNESIMRNPENAFSLYRRGMCYKELKDINEAIRNFSTSLDILPDYVDCLRDRATVYHNQGDYQSALRDSVRAVEIASATPAMEHLVPDLLDDRGVYYFGLGQYAAAIGDFTEAIRLKPGTVLFWHNRARTYHIMREYRKSINDFSVVVEMTPQDANAFHSRGMCYYLLGEMENAIKDYFEAIKIQPDLEGVSENIAKAHNRLLVKPESAMGWGTAPRERNSLQKRLKYEIEVATCDRCESQVPEGEVTWIAGGLRCSRCVSEVTTAVHEILRKHSIQSPYYFTEFCAIMISGEEYKGRWNWSAALCSMFWFNVKGLGTYFYAGMILVIISYNLDVGLLLFVFAAYSIFLGVRGTYIYYDDVVHKKNSRFREKAGTA